MGIPGLQSYISKNCSRVKQRVSLKDMVQEFKLRNPNSCNPEIVCSWFVGYDIYNTIYGQLDTVCGGQFLEFSYRIQSFVKRFSDLGIKLVFFFREGFQKEKLQRWVGKSCQKLHYVEKTFNSLKQTGTTDKAFNQYQDIFRIFFKQILVNLSINNDVCVQCVFSGENNDAIVNYAKENNCMAILTEDSDFIIYDTVPYLSVRELDIEKMETFMYNRAKFCEELRLEMKYLPIFASLCGNDIMSPEMLKQFHIYMLTNYGHDCLRLVSKFRTRSQLTPQLSNVLIPAINTFIASCHQGDLRQRILSQFSRLYNDESIKDLLHKSFVSYNADKPVEFIAIQAIVDVHEEPQTYLELCNYFRLLSNSVIYNVLTGNLRPYDISLEDVHSNPYVPCRSLYQCIRQHLYGIVIKNGLMVLPTDHVTEGWIEPNGEFKTNEVPYKLININGHVVTLKDLWFDENNKENSDFKLDVFIRCLTVSLSREALLSISPRHIPVVVIANYLLTHNEMKFEQWEICALILQAVHPKGQDRSWLQDLKFQHYEARAVHLAHIFTQGLLTVQDCLFVCNFPFKSDDTLFYKSFDGRRFHLCYQEMKEMQQQGSNGMDEARIKQHKKLLDNDEAAAALFSCLKEIAMDGVDSTNW